SFPRQADSATRSCCVQRIECFETSSSIPRKAQIMFNATRGERIEAEKLHRRGRQMRSMKVGVASFATFAGVTVAGVAPAYADYTVERGDSLSEIAAQHDNVTVTGLMQANGLSSSLIYP